MTFRKRVGAAVTAAVLGALAATVLTGPADALTLSSTPQDLREPTRADLPLWAVTHNGTTVYLLGSVHLLRPEAYPLDDALYEAFDESAIVAFELDFAEVETAAPAMLARGMFGDGRTLSGVLPAADYAALEAQLTELQIPIQALEPMKPWMVSLTLTSLVMQQTGYSAELGIDRHFHDRAVEGGKQVIAFETVAEQLDVFDGLGSEGQVALLRATLEEIETTSERMDEMTRYWETGETDALARLMTESMEGQEELMERILYQRNRNWVPKIEALLDGGETAIVIVGLGHMVGDGSVVDLLQEKGYAVTQMSSASAVEAGAR